LVSLNEIENGILRSNTASGATLFLKPFSENDPRQKIKLAHADPRIHFALNCGAKSCPPLSVYGSNDVENQLDMATKEYLETDEGLMVNVAENSVKLSKLFEWYKVDFGEDKEQILSWVLNFLEDPLKKQQVQNILRRGEFQLSHIDYNWGHNGI